MQQALELKELMFEQFVHSADFSLNLETLSIVNMNLLPANQSPAANLLILVTIPVRATRDGFVLEWAILG